MKVGVVGMGPTGVSLVCDLLARLALRPPDERVTLTLMDPAPELGPGYAFESSRILNMRARTLSMHPGYPDHFHRWLEAEGCISDAAAEFPPRVLFGRYLTSILAESLGSVDSKCIEVERWEARATRVERVDESIRVTDAYGETRAFAAVAMSIGESRYQALHALTGHPRFIPSPWAPELKEIPAAADVAVIGAGLSAVDACIDLLEQRHSGCVSCFARQRGFPKVQGRFESYEPEVLRGRWLAEETRGGTRRLPLRAVADGLSAELDSAMGTPYEPAAPDPREWFSADGRTARRQRSENDVFLEALDVASRSHTHWYYALDALEELTPALWNAIDRNDQLRFLRRDRALWNEYRHSMPIVNGAALAGAIRAGQLDIQRGMTSLRPPASGQDAWELTAGGTTRSYDYVIDATGGQPHLACEQDPLLRTCIANGSLTPDVRGGIRVDFRSCRAEDASGLHAPNLFFVGPLTFGTHFYTNSFTTNRINASRVARQIELMVQGRTLARYGWTPQPSRGRHDPVSAGAADD